MILSIQQKTNNVQADVARKAGASQVDVSTQRWVNPFGFVSIGDKKRMRNLLILINIQNYIDSIILI